MFAGAAKFFAGTAMLAGAAMFAAASGMTSGTIAAGLFEAAR